MRKNIVFFILLAISIVMSGCINQENETTPIKLAALLAMSGELGSKGEVRQFALEKGVEQTNKKWQEKGSKLQFDLKVADTESDGDVALEKAKALWEEGYKIFVAGSSAELEKLTPWANEQGAILISYSSTSPALSVVGDNLFRMVPDDTQQAKALASLLSYEGMYGIVPVYRDDVYGQELTKLLTDEMKELQVVMAEPVAYQPEANNWDEIITQVAAAVESLNLEKKHIAVVTISFDEATKLLEESAKVESLNNIRWFSSETITNNPLIIQDNQMAQFAVEKQLTGVTFGIPDSDLSKSVQAEIEEFAKGDFHPDALFAYDIPGMLATAIDKLEDPNNTEKLLVGMIEGSSLYAGVTGWTYLQENGDRKYYHYDIWEVQQADRAYSWARTAKFLNNPGTPGYIMPMTTANEGNQLGTENAFLFGYEDEPLNLERTVSRGEYIYMLMQAAKRIPSEVDSAELSFQDAEAIDERAKPAVLAAQKAGIIAADSSGNFYPNEVVTWFDALSFVVKAKEWPLESTSSTNATADEQKQAVISTAIEQGLITVSTDEFLKMQDEPIIYGDAMLFMLGIMKGDLENERVEA